MEAVQQEVQGEVVITLVIWVGWQVLELELLDMELLELEVGMMGCRRAHRMDDGETKTVREVVPFAYLRSCVAMLSRLIVLGVQMMRASVVQQVLLNVRVRHRFCIVQPA